jgi:hypothetical protein
MLYNAFLQQLLRISLSAALRDSMHNNFDDAMTQTVVNTKTQYLWSFSTF